MTYLDKLYNYQNIFIKIKPAFEKNQSRTE